MRALLSTEAQVDLRERVGLDARELEGELIEHDERRLLLSVRVPPPPTGFSSQPLHQRIDIAPQDVLRVDVRRLDGARTGVLIGGVLAAATAAVVVAAEGGNPGSPPNGGGPAPEESRRRFGISVPVITF